MIVFHFILSDWPYQHCLKLCLLVMEIINYFGDMCFEFYNLFYECEDSMIHTYTIQKYYAQLKLFVLGSDLILSLIMCAI